MELIYKDLISDELKELEISLLESISSDVDLATEISNYLLVSGGKRIRPSICILLAKVFNYEGNELIKLAKKNKRLKFFFHYFIPYDF